MSDDGERQRAREPEDLSRFFAERANTGDVEGLVALYEPDAVLALPNGDVAAGAQAIRDAYQALLAGRPAFNNGYQAPALVNGEFALTSTVLPGGATAELARRQPDGTWLWVIDRPNILAPT
ncbi:YybH family protein [Arthrobacter sp. A5]|uniref:YybH family protein n=1 Tax=Arthrobacter sp. A5 TaxID=576926 RepID=UPI003DAA4CB4